MMKICILSGNPKKEGLCQSVIDAAKLGVSEGGAEVDEIRLCDLELIRCKVCGNGWGPCRSENYCNYGADGFDEVKARIQMSDAIILASPVYWGEPSEAFKCFIDRLRRCEFNQTEVLRNKQVLLIASAGGTGNGLISCLEQMDRFCRHTSAIIFDYIGVNRWNSDYKRLAVKSAAHALASGRKNDDTV
ncbi:MAG: flavodoxin family protein [Desulfotomaculaceae bacterium]|nr:flavodoxin family protein [Desulfotomaculaceae bacterium]